VSNVSDLALVLTWLPPSDTGAGTQDTAVLTGFIITEAREDQASNLTAGAGLTTQVRGNLSKGRNYTYRIAAVNPAGESPPSRLVAEMAISRPSAPQNLTCEVVGSLRMLFQWDPPVDPGNLGYGPPIPLRQYQLLVLINTSLIAVQRVLVPYDSTNFTLAAPDVILTPGFIYLFRLLAENAAGLSPAAEAVKTAMRTPSEPLSMSALVTNPLEIRVSWLTPFNTGGLGQELPVGNYTLSVAATVDMSGAAVIFRGTATSFVHAGLTKGSIYFYRSVAENFAGVGKPSVVAFEEGVDLPTAPVLSVTESADLELTAAWTVPSDTGTGGQLRTLLAYVLEVDNVARSNGTFALSQLGGPCYAAQNPPCSPSVPPPMSTYRGLATAYTLTGLVKGLTYYLRVSAINHAGVGPASPVRVRQALVRPTVPRRFGMVIGTAGEGGGFVLRLDWDTPEETGAGVTALGQLPPVDPSVPGTAYTDILYISQVPHLPPVCSTGVQPHSPNPIRIRFESCRFDSAFVSMCIRSRSRVKA
jgi:hypothetical protein